MKETIYMDMDGVIVDFARGYNDTFGRNIYEDDGNMKIKMCLQIPRFFRSLPIIHQGLELFNFLKNEYKIVFLTTPMKEMDFCKIDKIQWIKENLGEYDVIFSDEKENYVVDERSILIDDYEKNISRWKEAGGTGIIFPQKTNKIISIINEIIYPSDEKTKIKNNKKSDKTYSSSSVDQGKKYKKNDIIDVKGLKIKIEKPKNSIKYAINPLEGKIIFKTKTHCGYILEADGIKHDPVDVFLGDELNKSLAFIVDINKENSNIKAMLGFPDVDSAYEGCCNFLANVDKSLFKKTNTKKLRQWLKGEAITY